MSEEYLDSRSRLLYVIRLTGLNGKDFAAKVNVSPSTISQITSTSDRARKTDLSEMVVNKILSAFPQFNLSYEWLLNGIGPKTVLRKQPSLFDNADDPANDNASSGQPVNNADASQSKTDEGSGEVNTDINSPIDLAEGWEVGAHEDQEGNGAQPSSQPVNSAATDAAGNGASSQPQQQSDAPRQANQGGAAQDPMPPSNWNTINDIIPNAPSSATVERIVIFYSDGTFVDYSPRRQR